MTRNTSTLIFKPYGRLLLLAGVAAACVAGTALYSLRLMNHIALEEREAKVRAAVESVHGVLEQYDALARSGHMTRAEAQRAAIDMVRGLRYEGHDYFWINDLEPRMIMHATMPTLDGSPLSDYRDPTGKRLFVEFVSTVQREPDGAGVVTYRWPKPGSNDPIRKLSFVKLYRPWGWIVGSGIYLDDLDAALAAVARRVTGATVLALALLGAGTLVALRGVRRAEQLELELYQAQKLEAVGRLAAGIAHEINTPIQFIGDNTTFAGEALTSYASYLERQEKILGPVPLPAEVREELRRAFAEAELPYFMENAPGTISRTLDGVKRVATIVRAMKEFAHPDRGAKVASVINRALQATLEVARNEYKYVADVETDLAEIPAVMCYPGELNQVFLNVIVNAAHAIEDVVKGTQARGKIRVSTRSEESQVIVAIADTGGGIPPAIQAKIFDPFFTTKEVGRGTGQGLAISRTIVRKHGGTITFATRAGEGTTFFIRLPAVSPAEAPGVPASAAAA